MFIVSFCWCFLYYIWRSFAIDSSFLILNLDISKSYNIKAVLFIQLCKSNSINKNHNYIFYLRHLWDIHFILDQSALIAWKNPLKKSQKLIKIQMRWLYPHSLYSIRFATVNALTCPFKQIYRQQIVINFRS